MSLSKDPASFCGPIWSEKVTGRPLGLQSKVIERGRPFTRIAKRRKESITPICIFLLLSPRRCETILSASATRRELICICEFYGGFDHK